MDTTAPAELRRRSAPVAALKGLPYSTKAAPYLFILPFLLTFVAFWLVPIVRSVVMSTQQILPGVSEFVGFDNYDRLLHDRLFWLALTNSFRYMLLTLVILIPLPLALAVLVNSKLGSPRLKAVFKSVMFVPALTSVVVAGIIFRLMFGESPHALMNGFADLLGFGPVRWLREDLTGLAALLALATWRWTGVNMLYFLAGLQAIPEEYYEAATVDGASAWQRFRHITVPGLKPTIVYVLTISVYGGLAMFIESYMLWGNNNSPDNIGLTIVGYLYRQGIEKNNLGYASAVGVVLLFVVLVINLTQLTLAGTFKKEDDR